MEQCFNDVWRGAAHPGPPGLYEYVITKNMFSKMCDLFTVISPSSEVIKASMYFKRDKWLLVLTSCVVVVCLSREQMCLMSFCSEECVEWTESTMSLWTLFSFHFILLIHNNSKGFFSSNSIDGIWNDALLQSWGQNAYFHILYICNKIE